MPGPFLSHHLCSFNLLDFAVTITYDLCMAAACCLIQSAAEALCSMIKEL